MFCIKCGNALSDNARFCSSCGALVEIQPDESSPVNPEAPVREEPAAAVYQAPKYVPPVQNAPQKKRPSKKLLAVGAAVLAVVLALVLVVAGVFSGDAAVVVKAITKSVAAYTDVAEKLNLPDVQAISQSGKYNQEVKLWLEDGAEEMNGLGLRATMSYNQSGKEAAIVAAPFFESTDLITAQLKLDGSKIPVFEKGTKHQVTVIF